MLLSQLIPNNDYIAEGSAAQKAHSLGYTSAGWGYWKDKNGKTVAKTVKNDLVPISDPDETPKTNKKTKEKKQIATFANIPVIRKDVSIREEFSVHNTANKVFKNSSLRERIKQEHKMSSVKQVSLWRSKLSPEENAKLYFVTTRWQLEGITRIPEKNDINDYLEQVMNQGEIPEIESFGRPMYRGMQMNIDTHEKQMQLEYFLSQFTPGNTVTYSPSGFTINPIIPQDFAGVRFAQESSNDVSVFIRLHPNPNTKKHYGIHIQGGGMTLNNVKNAQAMDDYIYSVIHDAGRKIGTQTAKEISNATVNMLKVLRHLSTDQGLYELQKISPYPLDIQEYLTNKFSQQFKEFDEHFQKYNFLSTLIQHIHDEESPDRLGGHILAMFGRVNSDLRIHTATWLFLNDTEKYPNEMECIMNGKIPKKVLGVSEEYNSAIDGYAYVIDLEEGEPGGQNESFNMLGENMNNPRQKIVNKKMNSSFKDLREENPASKKAHQLGLQYKGFGYWQDKNGKTVAKTVGSDLVPVDKSNNKSKQKRTQPSIDQDDHSAYKDPDQPINYFQQKISGPLGSNEGGIYQGSDGKQRYVKFYKEPAQAYSENLSNNLYKELGIPAPDSSVKDLDGKIAYMSDVVDNEGQYGEMPETSVKKKIADRILDGFAADVLLANWDAVGLVGDNILVTNKGPIRIDNGGSLLYRAASGRKSETILNNIPEWDGFSDANINPIYSDVFRLAGYKTPEDMGKRIVSQVQQLNNIYRKYGGWKQFIKKYAPDMDKNDSIQVERMLTARLKLLNKKANALL